MKAWHRRQTFAIAIYASVGLSALAWVGTYVQARSGSVSSGCWGPSIRSVVIPEAVPRSACVAFTPLAKVDSWISGEYVEVVSAKSAFP